MPRAPAHARRCAAGVSLRPLSGLPGDLEAFVDHYNHQCYYESINNVTPPTSTSGATKPFYTKGKDQETDNPTTPLATSKTGSIVTYMCSHSLQCSKVSK